MSFPLSGAGWRAGSMRDLPGAVAGVARPSTTQKVMAAQRFVERSPRVGLEIRKPNQEVAEGRPVVRGHGLKAAGGDEVARALDDDDVAGLDRARQARRDELEGAGEPDAERCAGR